MSIERLVAMANDIGDFFAAEPDTDAAVAGITTHMRRFWDPRMRKQILAYLQEDGSELSPRVRAAVEQLAQPANVSS